MTRDEFINQYRDELPLLPPSEAETLLKEMWAAAHMGECEDDCSLFPTFDEEDDG